MDKVGFQVLFHFPERNVVGHVQVPGPLAVIILGVGEEEVPGLVTDLQGDT
jgi:hypothetical protein